MALQYFKVLNAETKQPIDIVYGWDRENVLKKVERNLPDYRKYNNANIVSLVPATDEDLKKASDVARGLINDVYAAAGTAD